MNTCRLAVSAAFVRVMPGYQTTPKTRAVQKPVTIYHANPHGLRDGLRRLVHPGAFVDTTTVHERKRAALRCHHSQEQFLGATQGMSSYLRTMDDLSREVGALSRRNSWWRESERTPRSYPHRHPPEGVGSILDA